MADIEAQTETYKELVESTPDVELKGKSMLYTSVNGYMFSQINKAGEIGIRLPKDQAAAFIAKHDSGPFKSYGATMKEYVLVPAELLTDKKLASGYLHKSYQYTKSLPPK